MHRYVKKGWWLWGGEIKQEEQLMFKTHLLQYVREKYFYFIFQCFVLLILYAFHNIEIPFIIYIFMQIVYTFFHNTILNQVWVCCTISRTHKKISFFAPLQPTLCQPIQLSFFLFLYLSHCFKIDIKGVNRHKQNKRKERNNININKKNYFPTSCFFHTHGIHIYI